MEKNFNDYKEVFFKEELKNNKQEISNLESCISRKKWLKIGISFLVLLFSTIYLIFILKGNNYSDVIDSIISILSIVSGVLLIYYFLVMLFTNSHSQAICEFKIKTFKSPKFYAYLLKAEKRQENYLIENDFHISKTIDIENKKMNITLLLDKNEQFVFRINDNIYTKIYNIKNVVECNLIEENKNVTEHSVTTGTVVFGLLELLAGFAGGYTNPAYTKTSLVNYCTKLFLNLKIKTADGIDEVIIPFIETSKTQGSSTYKKLRTSACEIGTELGKYEIQNKYSNFNINPGVQYCRYCGAKNKTTDQKCSNCGAILK